MKMFSMDTFDFEAVMSRHLFEGSQIHHQSQSFNDSGISNGSDFFMGEDENTTDSDSYCGFNSDQENNDTLKE